jgi:hypothetical protein
MAIDSTGILNKAVSYSLASGLFARVNGHEPKSTPGSGITCAVWVDNIGPVPAASGLASTTARVILKQRIYTSMLAEPQDAIDPAMLAAVDNLIATYSADFSWGATVRNVDLLGETGIALDAQAGYVNIDGKLQRIFDVTIPLIINDLWDQAE